MKAVLVLAITTLSVGQPARGTIAGSWAAEFEGRTFIRLELRAVNDKVTGGISLGNFQVDAQGAVSRADAAPPTLTPILDVTLSGSTVRFAIQEGNDTDQFELRLLGNTVAELQVLLNEDDRDELVASGVTLPKPIRVTKAG